MGWRNGVELNVKRNEKESVKQIKRYKERQRETEKKIKMRKKQNETKRNKGRQ